jgi:hypothetical protein
MNDIIHPVLLCGGSGTRLWPLSRKSHPKQFVKLMDEENQSVYIPLGAVHRMENPGKLPLTLIEVQTGSYFGEDDIIRYEDVYSRG